MSTELAPAAEAARVAAVDDGGPAAESTADERHRLQAETARLRRELAVEIWRLESLQGRRWWRLAQAVAAARGSAPGLRALPRTAWRVLRTPSAMPARPGASGAARMSRTGRAAQLPAPSWSWTTGDDADLELHRWRQTLHRRPRDPGELVVAAVLDEFTEACFAPECSLVTFPPDGWREALEQRPPTCCSSSPRGAATAVSRDRTGSHSTRDAISSSVLL